MADEDDVIVGDGGSGGAGGQQSDPKDEAEAQKLGWRPKDQFKGDPERWVDAKEFIRRGNEFLPIVKSKLERAESRVAELETQLTAEIAGLKKMTRVALRRQHDQLTEKFEEQKRKAVESGDTESYDKIVAKQATATKELIEEAKEEKDDKEDKDLGDKSGLSKKDKATLEDWQADNKWFTTSRLLRAAADDHWDEIGEESPGLSFADRLDETRKRVEADFPAKFGKKPNGSGANAVEGGSRTGTGGRDASQFMKLPAAAKAQADDFIKKDGLFLEKGETVEKHLAQARERYARQYFADEEQANG